ncbi:MAG: acyl carrier protein [Labedaea sp.]
MSKTFTLSQLLEVMRSCAGVEDGVEIDASKADVEFEELGYDSLAVLEIAAQVQRQYGVPMPDECVEHMHTPSEAVNFILEQFEKAGV